MKNPYQGTTSAITIPTVARAGFTEKSYTTPAGISLNYVEGPHHGPALVLIPAQMATWEDYQKVLPTLSTRFHVFALDIRGHGKSSWTTGDYSWQSVGDDMRAFLRDVVKRPAIISGNSSGGIIALWCAANVPDYTRAIILEDAPLFAVEMPRFRDHDKYTYNGLKHIADSLGEQHDIANFFRIEAPVRRGNKIVVKRIPTWFVNLIGWMIRRRQRAHPTEPIDLPYMPLVFRLAVKSLSMFDPDFSRAFVDGRFYKGIDHEAALKKVACPMLLIHANWFRHPQYGLIGAMDADDAAHAQKIKPDIMYKKLNATHVIHFFDPPAYLAAFDEFVQAHQLDTENR